MHLTACCTYLSSLSKIPNILVLNMAQIMDDVIASSRGKEMKVRLRNLHPDRYCLKSTAKSALRLQDILDNLDSFLKPIKPHQMNTCNIYLIAGLCDVTYRDLDEDYYPNTPYDEVLFNETPDQAFQRVSSLIVELTSKIAERGATPVIATIVPSSLSQWNFIRLKQHKTAFLMHHKHYDSMQLNMVRTIHRLNKFILGVNNSYQMSTPMLACTVMKNVPGKDPRVHYGMLGEDGVHPTDDLRDLWAAKLIKAMRDNRYKPSQVQDEPHFLDSSFDVLEASLERSILERLNWDIANNRE